MCQYMHVYLCYVRTCIYIRTCICVMYVHVFVLCMCICVMYVHVCVYAWMLVYIRIYLCMHVCACEYMLHGCQDPVQSSTSTAFFLILSASLLVFSLRFSTSARHFSTCCFAFATIWSFSFSRSSFCLSTARRSMPFDLTPVA